MPERIKMTEQISQVLFDVGDPVTVVPPPEFPPEKPVVPEEDRTEVMVFSPPLAGATLSPCGKYRYVLWRKFQNSGKRILWICWNPSKADAVVDDASLRRMISLSKREGAAEIFVCNLFAYRATKPKDLRAAQEDFDDIYGPLNERSIMDRFEDCDLCIVGWGNGGAMNGAGRSMMTMLSNYNDKHISYNRTPIICFGVTKLGHPRHPLYVSNKTPLTPFVYSGKNDDGYDF